MSFPSALPSLCGPVLCWKAPDYDHLLAASSQSPRRRLIQPVHRTAEAPVQRLLNAMQPGTYVRPHRHPTAGACEGVVLIRGKIRVLIFDEQGDVIVHETLEQPGDLIDLEPLVWHSMLCLAPNTLIAEFKKGPYDPALDKEFAPWAPAEEEQAAVKAYLLHLDQQIERELDWQKSPIKS